MFSPTFFGFLQESWRFIRRRVFGDPPPPVSRASGFDGRVDALLAQIEQTDPSIHRLRQIPMDLIAEAVTAFLAEAGAPLTDPAIQRALRLIASRNALGPQFVQESRL